MKHLRILWIYLKSILHLSIYRIDVLNWAEYFYVGFPNRNGLCMALSCSCKCLNLDIWHYRELQTFFPKYNRANAQKFKEYYLPQPNVYWWTPDIWNIHGRLGFFYWLKDQYKNDRINLRKINVR